MQLLFHLYQAYLKRKCLCVLSHSLSQFFLWKCNYTFKKIIWITCKSFTKLTLLCHKVCLSIITYFRPSSQILCDGVVNLLTETSEFFITLRSCSTLSSAKRRPQSTVFRVPQRQKSQSVKSRPWEAVRGSRFHPTVAAPFPVYRLLCCLELSWRWRSWFIFLLAEPF